ncbi:AMP-binding protein [Nitrococcus mobilis]|uniref:Hypothetical acyltransferase family protein n=1 Tax=Nitrococcus mobilis Nb-231 TaxID=314278 RepID=A4BLA6_9GAMM|nr:AMP-binding protein [Nitrococcus mobilis]EAR23094.1 hypothetical acyltransferase family protein [Nitrococcus mobilis Nb-231]
MEAKSIQRRHGDEMNQLLELVRAVGKESGGPSRTVYPRPGDRLDQDLGIDSLARAELIMRCEREFQVNLPESAVQAETPEQLLDAVIKAGATPRRLPRKEPQYAPSAKEPGGNPEQARTLLEALDWHAQQHPQRTHLYIYGDKEEPEQLTYGELDRRASEVAAGLRERGIGADDTVALMLPTSRDYFVSFIGILLAGAVPVPLYPPARPTQLEEHLRRHGRILTNAGARVLVTVPQARRIAQLLKAEAPELECVITADRLAQLPGGRPGLNRRTDDLAMLQYTSGSTGDPKGISLAHKHLLANIRAIGGRIEATSEDFFVSWLPLYHDMGLIGAWFGSLYFGCPLAIMSPLAFLAHPLQWLWTIHRHRATLSASPNFGYELCVRAARSGALEGMDLSSWRIAFNGAESVSPATLDRFYATFRANGLRWETLMPVYGLAEAAVGLTISRPGRGPWVDAIHREVFTRSGEAQPAAENDPNPLHFVSCGPPLDGYEVRVVDTNDRELPERRQGAIQFCGPSATSGYYRNRRLNADLFHGTWLDSGDLGYLAKGELFVTGRIKDMIIRAGRNVYPHEVEQAVGEIEGVRKGCVAVFASPEEDTGIERLVIVAETHEQDPDRRQLMERQIMERVTELTDIPPDDVRLPPAHSVLKTSSGKIRRRATCELYANNRLGKPSRSVWWQIARLSASVAGARLSQHLKGTKETLYAGYAWSVFGLIALPTWLAVIVLPRRRWRWAVSRSALRTVAKLLGIPIEVAGLENLPNDRRVVFVANHASYIDPLVLTAALPRNVRFLAKQELRSSFFARVLLERLGTLMVERFDSQRARQEADRAEQVLCAGDSLAFFPEGTFTRAPGVRRFHLGAFQVAARARTPLIPVALSGTRSVLRGTEWFPRRLHLRVSVGRPIEPHGDDWQEIIRLRDEARTFIVFGSGEPDLIED